MIKKRFTANDIETKLKLLGAREVSDSEVKTSEDYSNIYRFAVESFEKKVKAGNSRKVMRARSIRQKKESV